MRSPLSLLLSKPGKPRVLGRSSQDIPPALSPALLAASGCVQGPSFCLSNISSQEQRELTKRTWIFWLEGIFALDHYLTYRYSDLKGNSQLKP